MVPARRKEITWLEEVSLPGREEAAGRDPAGTGWSSLLAGNVGGSAKEGAAGIVFSTEAKDEVAGVLGCCWSRCRG